MRIQKEIENVERVKDKIATMPLTMEDAIEFHKQVVDRIEKERKEINKELGLDSDIEEKGFTGASKEPKKVSTPELKKMKLSEALFESLNEGYYNDNVDEILNDIENILRDNGLDDFYPFVNSPSGDWISIDCGSDSSVRPQMKKVLKAAGYNADYDEYDDYIEIDLTDLVESLNEDVESVSIPAPYDKYFELEDEDQLEEYGWTKGEQIPNYDCHILAMLYPKNDEIDVYPILTDDPDYPVCEVAGGRLYPVEIQRRWKKLIKNESLNEEVDEDIKRRTRNTKGYGYMIDPSEELLSAARDFLQKHGIRAKLQRDKDHAQFVCRASIKFSPLIDEFKKLNDLFDKDYDGGVTANKDLFETRYVYFWVYGPSFEKIYGIPESLNECDKFKKGDCKNYALDEAKISRQNQRRKKDAYLQRKEAEREKAEKEARERERIGDAAWGEKDWIAEREKGDLDFSNYSDEERAEIEKRLKAFDDNKTAQAQYQRRKEAEEAKRAEEERKKAEQEKEERTKKKIERIGKLANAPKDIGNAFKKGLGIG